MNMTHLQSFLDAMHHWDSTGLAAHLSEGVVVRSPILPQPIEGKAAAVKVLTALLSICDAFEVTSMLTSDDRAVIFLSIRSGEVSVDGVDDARVDEEGLVASMTVQWRPLPAIVAMQQRLAPLIGVLALTLVPA